MKPLSFRFVVRCGVLALAAVLLLGALPWPWAALIPAAMSPYLTICSAIAARSFGVAATMGAPILIIVLLSRRWFCRWGCPVGLIVEVAGRLRPKAAKATALPPIGLWVALLTFAGACVGYPLLLWMDPMAMFSGFVGVFRREAGFAGLLSGIGLPIVVLITILRPNAWCGRLCPLGSTQDLLALARRFFRAGPSQTEALQEREPILARRPVLAMSLGAMWAAVTLRLGRAEASAPIRPPGAIAEQRFTGVCVRCGNCIRACPVGIIQPDIGHSGIAGFLSPIVRFDKDYCREGCRRCTEVCPSGAISRLSLDRKPNTRMGLAQVDMNHCLLSEDKECSICLNRCPYQAITIAFDEKTYTSAPRVDRRKCPGCGACELACPTTPKAIVVHPVGPR